jgi:uncharacterized membrane protein YeaQ/YmgE (transglycosylase-associated protein family)
MNTILFILIGIAAGWLAGKMMKGRGFGLVGDLVVGIVGALVGGFLFRILDLLPSGLVGSLITATVGALVLIAALRSMKR